jgi:hypothetical protein
MHEFNYAIVLRTRLRPKGINIAGTPVDLKLKLNSVEVSES